MTIKSNRLPDMRMALTMLITAGVLGVVPQTAFAATQSGAKPAGVSASQQRAWLAQEVRGLLKANPGAKQISPNAVQFRGAVIGVTPLASASANAPDSASGVCPKNHVCLFTNADFMVGIVGESWIDFKTCHEFFNLYDYHWVTNELGHVSSFANVTSSIDYPGTAINRVASFRHNRNGTPWLKLHRDHYLRNLANNPGPSPQHNSNDWITGLYAC